jgi:hypothetical protein
LYLIARRKEIAFSKKSGENINYTHKLKAALGFALGIQNHIQKRISRMNDTLSELARVKAIFQQRAICAALGISTTTHQAIAESAVDSDITMGAASQEGGITHERGATLQPSPANKTEKE